MPSDVRKASGFPIVRTFVLRGYASDMIWRHSLAECKRSLRKGRAFPHIGRHSRWTVASVPW